MRNRKKKKSPDRAIEGRDRKSHGQALFSIYDYNRLSSGCHGGEQ